MMIRVFRANAKKENAKHWISTETGSHLLLDGDGNVVGGAGGALKGQKFVKVTRKSKDVEEGNNNDPRMDRYKSIKDRMTKGEFEGPENKEKKETAKRLMKEYEAELGIDAKDTAQKTGPKAPAKEEEEKYSFDKNIDILTKKGIKKETAKKANDLFLEVANLYYIQDALWAFTGGGQKQRAIDAENKFKAKSLELDDFAEKNNINLEDLSVPSKEDIKASRAAR